MEVGSKSTTLRISKKRGQIRSFSQIFAEFCRVSVFLEITALGRRRLLPENRTFAQETEGNRRLFQKPVCPM